MLDGELDDLLHLLDLLVKSTNHLVSGVRHLLNTHQRNKGIDFTGKDLEQLVAITLEGDASTRRKLGHVDLLVESDDVLSFGVDLDQDVCLAHGLDHLSNVSTRLLQTNQLITHSPHLAVQFISLCRQTTEVFELILEHDVELIDLALIVGANPFLSTHTGSAGVSDFQKSQTDTKSKRTESH